MKRVWLCLCLAACAPSEPAVGVSTAPLDEPGRSQAPPTGGGGYEFGASQAEAQARCTSSQGQWRGGAASACMTRNDAAGASLLTVLEFCAGALCRVHSVATFDAPDAKTWLSAFEHLRRELQNVYGPPDDSDADLPADCEAHFSDCVRAGRATARMRWFWEDGHAVMLRLGSAQGVPAGISVSYAKSEK